MLLKKICIMKGNSEIKSVLKVSLLEKSHTEIELNAHYAYGEGYTFILKSGVFIHQEGFDGKRLKRKLPPFDIDKLTAGICYNGEILAWTAPTPQIPYVLQELAQKYSIIKVENKQINKSQTLIEETASFEKSDESVSVDEKEESAKTVETAIESESEEPQNSTSENVDLKESVTTQSSDDISKQFNILEVDNSAFSEIDGDDEQENSLAREIEDKYNTLKHNEVLEGAFPGSKWIIEENNDFSLGLLYNSSEITHICYAKAGEIDKPIEPNASFYEGYWIVFEELE